VTSAVVLSNLLYPIGAVAVAIVICALIMLRHHRPRSVESNISSFNRGLKALAPQDGAHARRVANPPRRTRGPAEPGQRGDAGAGATARRGDPGAAATARRRGGKRAERTEAETG
jgi:hypothetical protein